MSSQSLSFAIILCLADNDLRIPFIVTGPGVAAGTTFTAPATNVDTMPTLLGLAGLKAPQTMDGRSLAPLLVSRLDDAPLPTRQLLAPRGAGPGDGGEGGRGVQSDEDEDDVAVTWRDAVLIEYHGLGNVVRWAGRYEGRGVV